MDYLKPDFDPKEVRVADLRRILTENGVSFPSRARKVQLIRLFDNLVRPKIPELRRKFGIASNDGETNSDSNNNNNSSSGGGGAIESSRDVKSVQHKKVVNSSPSRDKAKVMKRTRDILEEEDKSAERERADGSTNLPDAMEVDNEASFIKSTTSAETHTVGSPSHDKKKKRKKGRGEGYDRVEEDLQNVKHIKHEEDLPEKLLHASEFAGNRDKVSNVKVEESASSILGQDLDITNHNEDGEMNAHDETNSKLGAESNEQKSNVEDTAMKPSFTIEIVQKQEMDHVVSVTHSVMKSSEIGNQHVETYENASQLSKNIDNETGNEFIIGHHSSIETSEQFVSVIECSRYGQEGPAVEVGTKILPSSLDGEKPLEVVPEGSVLSTNTDGRESEIENEGNLQGPTEDQGSDGHPGKILDETEFTSFPNNKLFDIWSDDKTPLDQLPSMVSPVNVENASAVTQMSGIDEVKTSIKTDDNSRPDSNESSPDASTIVVDSEFEIQLDDSFSAKQAERLPVSLCSPMRQIGQKLAKVSCLLAAFLILTFATLYVSEGFRVGYCGHELPIRGLPHNTMLSDRVVKTLNRYLEILKPSCIPCPNNALCHSNLIAECIPGFNLRNSTFSLGGLLPIGPYCIKDTSKEQLSSEIFAFVLKQLRYRNSFCNCGTSKSDMVSGFTDTALFALAMDNFKERIDCSLSEFEKVWNIVSERLKSLPEISYTERENGTRVIRTFRSTSLEDLSLKCRLGPYVHAFYVRLRKPLFMVLVICLLAIPVRTLIIKRLREKSRLRVYVTRAVDELKQARTRDGDVEFLHNLQLRDIVLYDVPDPIQRNMLWRRITEVLEKDTANISCTQSEYYGEILMCWKWIGNLSEGGKSTSQ